MAKFESGVSPTFCQKFMTSVINKICNGVPSYRVGEESRANPKGLTLPPNIYPSERYQVTKKEYGLSLEKNLTALVEKLHRMSYTPLPVRRVYIPKPGSSKERPLGIPALEDKLVQAGLARILSTIYEQDFIDDSYGFRPGRGCHDALRALSQEVEGERIHYIVDADIKGFFDNVDHEWLMKFLGHRIADKRVLRYVKRFLIAGIMEDGAVIASDKGTPQGGIVAPLTQKVTLNLNA